MNNTKLEINGKQVGSFEVVRYSFTMIDSEPKILIHQVRVNDLDGKYLKFAKLKEVLPYLCLFPVKFKDLIK
jgi:hypothetical protein